MDGASGGSARTPVVSVTIPCYRQLHHARQSIASIRAQSLTDFELTLVDDGASEEYRTLVDELGDPRVHYRRNAERLGAMHNMFQAIHVGTGKYTIAFHEDDLMGRHYLSAAVSALDANPDAVFAAADLREFTDGPSEAELGTAPGPSAYDVMQSAADVVRAICRGRNPMFGSVVYRRSALAGGRAAHADYGTLVDRPFLLSLMASGPAVLLGDPLVWYRHHPGDVDARHAGMSADHIVQLMRTYRAMLPSPLRDGDRDLFYAYTGYWLLRLYTLLPEAGKPPLGRFLFRAWRQGLYDPRWERGVGRKRLIWSLITGDRLAFP